MFIKHGDGKITDIVEVDELTDEQKQAVKKMSKQIVKESDKSTDTSQVKKSGR